MAGDSLQGPRVFALAGEGFEEITPPADLLRHRRFTALAADGDGRLLAATDGMGVLVYVDGAWSANPVNDALPTATGTGLKPVSCMTLDHAGNLWVGMDNNVICWPNEQKAGSRGSRGTSR